MPNQIATKESASFSSVEADKERQYSSVAPLSNEALPRSLASIYSLDDLVPLARRRLPHRIFSFIEGGVETNSSREANRASYAGWTFRPRVLVDTRDRQTEAELFGRRYSAPFGIAPMGATSVAAFECERVLAEGARRSNIPFILSGASLMPLETVIEANPNAWFQAYVPGDRERVGGLVERVARAGYKTLVVTVDVAVNGNRENNARNGFSLPLRPTPRLAWDGLSHPHWLVFNVLKTLLLRGMPRFANVDASAGVPMISPTAVRSFGRRDSLSWDDIAWLRARWHGKLVLKGILAAEDAAKAAELGIDGIIVSNHGGRQLDGSLPPLDALAEILPEAAGMTVMIDGGIRRGTDILKAVALGASFAFIGRPFMYAASIGSTDAVSHIANLLSLEIDRNLALLGCCAVNDVTRDYLVRRS